MKRFILVFLSCIIISCNDTITADNNDEKINCNELYNGLELSSFYLQDLNSTSGTFNQFIRPEDFDGRIRLFYFTSNEN